MFGYEADCLVSDFEEPFQDNMKSKGNYLGLFGSIGYVGLEEIRPSTQDGTGIEDFKTVSLSSTNLFFKRSK